MIEVSPEQAFLLYLAAGVLAIIGIWLHHHLRAKKKEVVSFRQHSFQCEFCSSIYVDDPMKPLTRCPECQSLNKNIHPKKQ